MAQQLEGAKELWEDFPIELQARLSASRAIHMLRGGIAEIQKEEEKRGEEKFMPGSPNGLTGLCVALTEFFNLSGALNEEAAAFDAADLNFATLLARLLAKAEQAAAAQDKGDIELDLEALLSAAEAADGQVAGSPGAIALRKEFEDGDGRV